MQVEQYGIWINIYLYFESSYPSNCFDLSLANFDFEEFVKYDADFKFLYNGQTIGSVAIVPKESGTNFSCTLINQKETSYSEVDISKIRLYFKEWLSACLRFVSTKNEIRKSLP